MHAMGEWGSEDHRLPGRPLHRAAGSRVACVCNDGIACAAVVAGVQLKGRGTAS